MGVILTEKFNSTMPGWLRKRLLYTDSRPSKDGGYQSQDIHPRARGDSSPSKGLFKDFVEKNIDLHNAKFISVDPQSLQKRNDPRLKEPYMPIFHLAGNTSTGEYIDTVYAVGINDTDKWPGSSYKDEFYEKAFRSIPLKRLLEYAKDFCYLDLSDPTNFIDQEKMTTRKDSLQGYEQRYTPVEIGSRWGSKIYKLKSLDTGRMRSNRYGDVVYNNEGVLKILDKSGYIKNPNKFESKLKELKAKNYSKVLNDIYSRIKTLQAGMIEAFSDYNFKNLQGNISSDSFSKFQKLVLNYNDLLSQVDYVVRNYSDEPESFSNEMQNLFNTSSGYYKNDYANILDTLRDLEASTSDYINVPIDWDVEEEEFDEALRESIYRRRNRNKKYLRESLFRHRR